MKTKPEHNEIPETFRDHWEWRRFRAWELHEAGWPQARIAEALDVTGGAVSQWFKKVREQGLGALRSRREESGRRPGLSAADLKHLEVCLKRGPEAYGFRGAVWTQPRVREVIRKEFDITYTPRHVGRLLKKIEWTRQKPAQRADQRDEDAVTEWCEDTLPELKKKPFEKNGPSSL
jgi:transposase